MKLSNYSLNYPALFAQRRMDVFQFLSLCRQLGVEGASLHVRHLAETAPEYLKRVRRAYLDNGLAVTEFTVSTNFGVPGERQDAELQKARGTQGYDERLLAFYGSLDRDEDVYFIRATETDVGVFRNKALRRAQEMLNRAQALWRGVKPIPPCVMFSKNPASPSLNHCGWTG